MLFIIIFAVDIIFMISLFVRITDSDGDLTNWIMLVISILILFPVAILIGNIISKDITNKEQEMMKTFFKIERYLDNKKIFDERIKLVSISNDMISELQCDFIKNVMIMILNMTV